MFTKTQTVVRERLSDNFDTPEAVIALSQLITATNSYLQIDRTLIKLPLVRQISKYVFKILKAFGVYEDEDYPNVLEAQKGDAQVAAYEDTIAPLMDALTKFRDQIKERAGEGPGQLFKICDELRDDILPHLGIRLEDRGKGQASIWKYEDKDILLKEREAKIQEKERKEQEKRRKAEEELRLKATPPRDYFRVFKSAEFSQFDPETGVPTHDSKGKELSEAIRNKLKKD